MSEAVFALQEAPPKSPDQAFETGPAPSALAAALRRWASVACRLGMVTAGVPVIASLAYVALVAEPLWQRLMTLVVVGVAPAAAAVAAGFLLGGALDLAGRLADPAATLVAALARPLWRAVRL